MVLIKIVKMMYVKLVYVLGHKLLHKQEDIPIDGWAVECRVYAEVNAPMIQTCNTLNVC